MNTETLKEIFNKVEFFQDPIITASQQNNDFRALVEPGNEFPFIGIGFNDMVQLNSMLKENGLYICTIWTNFDKPSSLSFHLAPYKNEQN